jgi:hypothetical protein
MQHADLQIVGISMKTRGGPADHLHERQLRESIPSPLSREDASGYTARSCQHVIPLGQPSRCLGDPWPLSARVSLVHYIGNCYMHMPTTGKISNTFFSFTYSSCLSYICLCTHASPSWLIMHSYTHSTNLMRSCVYFLHEVVCRLYWPIVLTSAATSRHGHVAMVNIDSAAP